MNNDPISGSGERDVADNATGTIGFVHQRRVGPDTDLALVVIGVDTPADELVLATSGRAACRRHAAHGAN